MNLNDQEIYEAQCCIDLMISGPYELKKIYGNKWGEITGKNIFGRKFKKSVEGNLLKNIRVLKKKTNNHWIYEIL